MPEFISLCLQLHQPHNHVSVDSPGKGVCLLKHSNVLLMERHIYSRVALTQAWTVSLKLDYSELNPGQALLEGDWIREKNRV